MRPFPVLYGRRVFAGFRPPVVCVAVIHSQVDERVGRGPIFYLWWSKCVKI